MSNLFSQPDKWVSMSITSLVREAKTSQDWSTGLATVDAVSAVLAKMSELYVSEAGDVRVFLHIVHPTKNKIKASVVAMTTESDKSDESKVGEPKIIRSVEGKHETRELAAAFICNFPNAVFTVPGGYPLFLFIKTGDEKRPIKRWVSLANVAEASRSGYTNFAIAVPSPKSDTEAGTPKDGTPKDGTPKAIEPSKKDE